MSNPVRPIRPSDETTLAPAAAATPHASPTPSGWLSSGASAPGTLELGSVLAERYRITGFVGRGGMGDVYRAEDLRLGQTVGLKFLPEAVATDPQRLAMFHNEVRIARQVAHRNVCRVYDIGEADGRIFLTMEFVDGEDLATLLRRIGRLPSDKALEIARQLCAGLAAAHDLGVLHRDLKPANIMLDNDGRVRITDFGLAGVAGEITDITSGTPGYMSPEQLTGRGVSTRSDLYSLGLVLAEVFTGKRVFDAKNVAQLLRMHDDGPQLTTSASHDLNPVVERVLLRCLERDPLQRPGSALAVSASLPGGDPLAAALAAGETPSREMVANAGHREALSVARGLAALGAIVVLLLAMVAVQERVSVVNRVPFPKPPAVLEDRAKAMLGQFGYTDPPLDSSASFFYTGQYVRYASGALPSATRWDALATGRVPVIGFWYRTSPRPLVPYDYEEPVPTIQDPPLTVPGMTTVGLDTEGRLIEFHAVPPQQEDANAPAPAEGASTEGTSSAAAGATPPPDWSRLFQAADLPLSAFTPATPVWTPHVYADARAAWLGTSPDLPGVPLRVEAASYRGRPVYFQVIGPWAGPPRTSGPTPQSRLQAWTQMFAQIGIALVMGITALVTYRNLKARRGDRIGALRAAGVTALLSLTAGALAAKHYPDFNVEMLRFVTQLGQTLFVALMLWMFYMVFEPAVRRFWPEGLIAWSRLLGCDWRDPLIGRDVLAGIIAGLIWGILTSAPLQWASLLGREAAAPRSLAVLSLQGVLAHISIMLMNVLFAMSAAFLIILVYALLRRAIRNRWLVVPLTTVVLTLGVYPDLELSIPPSWLSIGMPLLFSAILLTVLLRFGLFALVVTMAVGNMTSFAPLTFNLRAWFAPMSLITIGVVLTLALAGYYAARGGQPLFGRLLDE